MSTFAQWKRVEGGAPIVGAKTAAEVQYCRALQEQYIAAMEESGVHWHQHDSRANMQGADETVTSPTGHLYWSSAYSKPYLIPTPPSHANATSSPCQHHVIIIIMSTPDVKSNTLRIESKYWSCSSICGMWCVTWCDGLNINLTWFEVM
jgi:hypothetical protein